MMRKLAAGYKEQLSMVVLSLTCRVKFDSKTKEGFDLKANDIKSIRFRDCIVKL